MHNIEWIEDFRLATYTNNKNISFTVEYKLEEDEWYDLFEDPSKEICELIVEALKEKLLDS